MFKTTAMLLAVSLLCLATQVHAGSTPTATTTGVSFGNYLGAWKTGTTYAAGSVVTFAGGTYFALGSNTNTNPFDHPFKWAQLPAVPMGIGTSSTAKITNLGQFPGTLILQEMIPATGEYALNATAVVGVDESDTGVYCFITTGSNGPASDGVVGGTYNPFTNISATGQAAIADFWFVAKNDFAQLYCYSEVNDANSYVAAAGLNGTMFINPLVPNSPTETDAAAINNKPEVKPTLHVKQQQ